MFMKNLTFLFIVSFSLTQILCAPLHAAEDENKVYLTGFPEIEAKIFDATVNRKSKSNRVYLFSTQSKVLPKIGKILLFAKETQPIMGFRVIKTYPTENQFAASRVKMYTNETTLSDGSAYNAVEKTRDLDVPYYSKRDQKLDELDLLELEREIQILGVNPYDPALDEEKDKTKTALLQRQFNERIEVIDSLDSDEELEDYDSINPDQYTNFEKDRHWITLDFGFLKNLKLGGDSAFFSGGGLRYGINIAQRFLAKSTKAQDSLTLEGSLFYYSIDAYETEVDAFTILPLGLSLRYNLFFSQTFGLFFYGGFLKNNVMDSTNASDAAISQLSLLAPALGAGLILQLGPKWYARADLGVEFIGLGLVLRF